jgi:S1-C subfamily serine protease
MFPDVTKDSYAYRAIEWAQKNGVIAGFPDGTFKPLEPVTREQFAVLLYKMSLRDGTFQDIIPAIMPSVGMIMAGNVGIGSCVCVKSGNGISYLVTNNHVTSVGNPWAFIKTGYTNTPATLIKTDSAKDLSLLTVPINVNPCAIAAAPAAVGQPVCVCGAPAGQDESASVGIISHLNRNEGKWFQTDAPSIRAIPGVVCLTKQGSW